MANANLLNLDYWGLDQFGDNSPYHLLETLEDRPGRGTTMMISQLPVDRKRELINYPAYAASLLGHLVHGVGHLELAVESMCRLTLVAAA